MPKNFGPPRYNYYKYST